MRNQEVSKNRDLARTLIALGGTLVAVVWLFATPALAGNKHKNEPKHRNPQRITLEHPGYRGPVVKLPPRILNAPRRVVVPTVIRRDRVQDYRPYYGGRVVYGPHGHELEVYFFPVYRHHRYVYEPHYYRAGYHVSTNYVALRGPNVSFQIAF